jgi:hypothetical protein
MLPLTSGSHCEGRVLESTRASDMSEKETVENCAQEASILLAQQWECRQTYAGSNFGGG